MSTILDEAVDLMAAFDLLTVLPEDVHILFEIVQGHRKSMR